MTEKQCHIIKEFTGIIFEKFIIWLAIILNSQRASYPLLSEINNKPYCGHAGANTNKETEQPTVFRKDF